MCPKLRIYKYGIIQTIEKLDSIPRIARSERICSKAAVSVNVGRNCFNLLQNEARLKRRTLLVRNLIPICVNLNL